MLNYCVDFFRADYYNDNMHLPVFERGRTEYAVSELASILLCGVQEDKVCKKQPVSVEHNCSFVVDLSCVMDATDLKVSGRIGWYRLLKNHSFQA